MSGKNTVSTVHRVWMIIFIGLLASNIRATATTSAARVALGQSTVLLNGPWKFHTGDNAAWADPNFDDSTWESVDLTAPEGAHDADVGLSRYVAGWGARGHEGYWGYGWYRLRVDVFAAFSKTLVLSGPPAVDSAYQVFVNGQRLGDAGRFSGKITAAFSIQPRRFAIPQSVMKSENTSLVIAFRVWSGPWDLEDPSGGGIRIAPALGEKGSIDLLYEAQWVQTIAGYIVEVVEAAAFILLAIMAWTLGVVEQGGNRFSWLCIAMLLTALFRANQAAFFWGQFETVQGFEAISVTLITPLCLAAWTLGWRQWLGAQETEWVPRAVGVLTIVYVAAQFFTGSWLHGEVPHPAVTIFSDVITATRILFIGLTGFISYQAVRLGNACRRRSLCWALLVLLLISIGQFAREVSAIGIPGIWFPFGTGVSRTQYAYAGFDVVFFLILLHGFFALRGIRGVEAGESYATQPVQPTIP